MYACLYSLSSSQSDLVKAAQDFTPRFETIGPLVMLDLSGLSRLFGSAREIGEQLRRSMGGAPVRIAIASSQTAAALLALGRPGLTVVSGEEQPAAIAPLPVSLLSELEKLRQASQTPYASASARSDLHVSFGETSPKRSEGREGEPVAPQAPQALQASQAPQALQAPQAPLSPPHVGDMEDVLPYFQSCLDRTSELASKPHANCGGGWRHPRDTHGAQLTKRARRPVTSPKDDEHPLPAADARRPAATATWSGAATTTRTALKEIQSLLDVLRRWGVKTLGALAALPAGDVYERLGARGVSWQRLARGADQGPLVPCVPEDPFEGTLDLEWPIDGLEPLSFVLARLFEPLAERLERAARGAAILHTHLRLTTREVYARTVQLPAPMRDPKTLRTLVLLDLESNPPSAAIDRVRVIVEPTPAKVLQWTLYERAQPSPEQVSTLLARLTALMGDGHVGSPKLVDSWKPGAFELAKFALSSAPAASASAHSGSHASFGETSPKQPEGGEGGPVAPGTALRRYRLPIPARVHMQDGRPARVMVDRRGVTGGAVKQSAGPWRTSGEWWKDGPLPSHLTPPADSWDRDEWDVLLNGGAAYRIFVERAVGQWFIEGVLD